ncbi:hypothetical protein NDU88_012443, partial [Pleurodeles waltl]
SLLLRRLAGGRACLAALPKQFPPWNPLPARRSGSRASSAAASRAPLRERRANPSWTGTTASDTSSRASGAPTMT